MLQRYLYLVGVFQNLLLSLVYNLLRLVLSTSMYDKSNECEARDVCQKRMARVCMCLNPTGIFFGLNVRWWCSNLFSSKACLLKEIYISFSSWTLTSQSVGTFYSLRYKSKHIYSPITPDVKYISDETFGLIGNILVTTWQINYIVH